MRRSTRAQIYLIGLSVHLLQIRTHCCKCGHTADFAVRRLITQFLFVFRNDSLNRNSIKIMYVDPNVIYISCRIHFYVRLIE
jgi:hypothetical protein